MPLLPFLVTDPIVSWGDRSLSGGDNTVVQGQAEACAADPSPLTVLLLPLLVMGL